MGLARLLVPGLWWFVLPLLGDASDSKVLIYRIESLAEREHRTNRIFIRYALPVSEPNVQEIRSISFSPQPSRIIREGARKVAEWTIPSGRRPKAIRMDVEAELFLNQQPSPDHPPPKDLSPWLKADRYVQIDHPDIQKWAAKVERHDDFDLNLKILLDAVVIALKYSGYESEDQGALAALKSGQGDCTEYADLLVALCRSKGIPSRSRLSIKTEIASTPLHHVTQIYDVEKGWVTLDPLWHEFSRTSSESRIPTDLLFLSTLREDPLMFGSSSFLALKVEGKQLPSRITSRFQVGRKDETGAMVTEEFTHTDEWPEKP